MTRSHRVRTVESYPATVVLLVAILVDVLSAVGSRRVPAGTAPPGPVGD